MVVCYRCGVQSLPGVLHSCVAASKAFWSCSVFYHISGNLTHFRESVQSSEFSLAPLSLYEAVHVYQAAEQPTSTDLGTKRGSCTIASYPGQPGLHEAEKGMGQKMLLFTVERGPWHCCCCC